MQEQLSTAPVVGLVTIATGRYVEFLPALIASARQHLLGLGPVFVLTDAEAVDALGDVLLLPWERMDWPLPTLLRYRGFTKYAAELSAVDVLLYTDADMLFVGDVDLRNADELIAVRHPGYVHTAVDQLPYERRTSSNAFVPIGSGTAYFCGGVQGGRASAYLAAAKLIDAGIEADQANGVTAKWHDESHWNHYLAEHPALLQLGAEYCTPDIERTELSKILAITKDHAQFRELKGFPRLAWMLRNAKSRLGKVVRSAAGGRR